MSEARRARVVMQRRVVSRAERVVRCGAVQLYGAVRRSFLGIQNTSWYGLRV